MPNPPTPRPQKNTRPALDATVVDRRFRETMELLAGIRGRLDEKGEHAVRHWELGDIREYLATLNTGASDLSIRLTSLAGQVTTIEARVQSAESSLLVLQAGISGAQSDVLVLQSDIGSLQASASALATHVTAVTVPALTSSAATGGDPPTEAEYNALRTDVSNLRTAVLSLQAAILA